MYYIKSKFDRRTHLKFSYMLGVYSMNERTVLRGNVCVRQLHVRLRRIIKLKQWSVYFPSASQNSVPICNWQLTVPSPAGFHRRLLLKFLEAFWQSSKRFIFRRSVKSARALVQARRTTFNNRQYSCESTALHLTLCVPCIILKCVDDQRDAQFL